MFMLNQYVRPYYNCMQQLRITHIQETCVDSLAFTLKKWNSIYRFKNIVARVKCCTIMTMKVQCLTTGNKCLVGYFFV